MRLRITSKAVILVAAFIFCEVALLLTLGWQLGEYKRLSNEAQRSEEIIAEVHSIMMLTYQSASTLFRFSYMRKQANLAACDRAIEDLPRRVNRLETLCADDKSEAELLETLKPEILEGVDLIRQTRQAIHDREKAQQTWKTLTLVRDIEKFADTLLYELSSIVAMEQDKQRERGSLARERQTREIIENLVVLGVVFNILSAILVTLMVTRRLTRRIEILKDNTIRLSNGESLLEPIGGDDELGTLEHSFHKMARKLSESEQLLKDNEARVQSFIDTMPVGLIVIDDRGQIERANPYTESIFGYRGDQLIGQRIATLFCDSDTMTLDAFLEMLTEKAMGRLAQIQAVKEDGKTFPVEVKLSILHTTDGTRLVLNIVDLSDKHEVERLKKEMVSMVSHDLKTPLSSIQSALALLSSGKMGQLSTKGRDLIDGADREIDRLIKLIKDLLDISKMESGKLELSFSTVSMRDLLERSVSAIEGFKASRSIEVKATDEDFELVADPERTVQVIVNLLSNAIKFSPLDSTVTLSAREKSDCYEILVIDEGPGISSDFRDRLFTRFERADDAASSAIEGTGIGLAICKSIVEGHGGEIGVRNNEGKGCTFWFTVARELKQG